MKPSLFGDFFGFPTPVEDVRADSDCQFRFKTAYVRVFSCWYALVKQICCSSIFQLLHRSYDQIYFRIQ